MTTPPFSDLVLVCALLAAGGAGAEVYKWVDGQGRVHYGDAKPDDRSAQTVAPPPAPPEEEVLRARSRFDELLERQRAADRQEAGRQEGAANAAQEEAQRKSRCRYAQQGLHVLELERPVYRLDEQGNRVYLEDGRRAGEVERARRQVKEHCR